MRKCCFLWVFTIGLLATGHAQNSAPDSFAIRIQNWQTDSLEALANASPDEATKLTILNDLGWRFAFNQPEKGLSAVQKAFSLARKLGNKRGEADAYQNAAWCQWALGDYAHALQYALQSLHLFEELKDGERVAWSYLTLANIYRDFGDYEKAIQTAHQSISHYDAVHISPRVALAVAASVYNLLNKPDSALLYLNRAEAFDLRDNQGKWGWIHVVRGDIYRRQKRFANALASYRVALPKSELVNVKKDIVEIYNGIALVHQEAGNVDSAIFYASRVLQQFSTISYQKGVLDAINILTAAFKRKNNKDSVIKYLDMSTELSNRLFNQEKQREVQSLAFGEQLRLEELEREQQQYRDRLKMYAVLGFGFVLLVVAALLWRNNRHKQRAYALVQQQKSETERAYEQLKSTQQQLVQQEKMASLGELTAGIAHEIQNPLNFVNNFSAVNQELFEEMQEEWEKGNVEEAKAIANSIKANEEKISHHGQRADSIVKSMLQHSRSGAGEKQPTNINQLADEYLRLSYQGMRAKDKTFNAAIETNFDNNVGNVNVIAQGIGRVFLNLFNNAFYAVQQKKVQGNGAFEPLVFVSTKRKGDKILITVRDNGTGIPAQMMNKVFQPFFTTKPTGEGTGLGLSLSYDIIKAHVGELRVESSEGAGSEFTVIIPTT